MTMQDPLFKPTGVATNLAQPQSPLMSSDEAFMARQTEALWRHCSLTRRSWSWPIPDESAPYLVTSSVNSYQVFANGNGGTGLVNLPWFSQKGVTHIGAQITVALDDTALDFAIQLKTSTLITAVTAKTSEEAIVRPGQSPVRGAWSVYGFSNQDRKLVFGTVTTRVAPEYPASRRISLTLQGVWKAIANPTGLSITRKAYLVNLMVWDIPPAPDGT